MLSIRIRSSFVAIIVIVTAALLLPGAALAEPANGYYCAGTGKPGQPRCYAPAGRVTFVEGIPSGEGTVCIGGWGVEKCAGNPYEFFSGEAKIDPWVSGAYDYLYVEYV